MIKRTIVCLIVGLFMLVSLIPSVQCQSVNEEIIEKFNLEDFEEDVKIDSMIELILYILGIIIYYLFGPPM